MRCLIVFLIAPLAAKADDVKEFHKLAERVQKADKAAAKAHDDFNNLRIKFELACRANALVPVMNGFGNVDCVAPAPAPAPQPAAASPAPAPPPKP